MSASFIHNATTAVAADTPKTTTPAMAEIRTQPQPSTGAGDNTAPRRDGILVPFPPGSPRERIDVEPPFASPERPHPWVGLSPLWQRV
ncbi:hypothetical protein GCM10023322_01610 [Rugosimonospora acidiphila]|uniref:Uncharacterized protein n=1 Tax=Rugosimonospora acidiphila TaxID=556531 RepID=A0ABP9RGF9_9ACTN